VFAEAVGLDGELLAPALLRSAAESRVMHRKLPKMLHGEFSAEGRLEQSLKDVHSMLECARRSGVRLPLLEAQANLLASGVAAGEGHRDNSVVIEELRRRVEHGLTPA
jgi:3-hydroxyisobutyrate dehydrogenase-like beta-hydroxyacid dehydrogenase